MYLPKSKVEIFALPIQMYLPRSENLNLTKEYLVRSVPGHPRKEHWYEIYSSGIMHHGIILNKL